mgnify:FL=1
MIVEKASDNKYFEIGDLVSVVKDNGFYHYQKNGIVTETFSSLDMVYYAVYWPRGDVEIVFSGALEKADGE